jgi:hypothetical protein
VFAGKVLAAGTVVIGVCLMLAASGLIAGVVLVGAQSLVNVSGALTTAYRLSAAIGSEFNNVTLLQQALIGRHAPPGAKLDILPYCNRRAAAAVGPGDWNCTLYVYLPQPTYRHPSPASRQPESTGDAGTAPASGDVRRGERALVPIM